MTFITLPQILFYLSSFYISCFNMEGWLRCSSLDTFYSLSPQFDVHTVAFIGSASNLMTLKSNSFINWTHLKRIDLNNVINMIEPNAFQGLMPNVTDGINIDENNIPFLKANAFNLTGQFTLVLWNNKIKDIEPGTFGSIESIYLNKNEISKIRKGVFTNLDIALLHLSSNQISVIEENAFSGMKNLKVLELDNNKLKYFDMKTYFGDADNLSILKLRNNQLMSIENNKFALAPKLTGLALSENSIKEISKNNFEDLQLLEYLELSYNQLTKIDADVFPANNKLEYLFLDNNNLTYLSPELLSNFKNLEIVAVYNNPIQCSCKTDFEKWTHKNNVLIICRDETMCIKSNDVCKYDLNEVKYEKISSEKSSECDTSGYKNNYFELLSMKMFYEKESN